MKRNFRPANVSSWHSTEAQREGEELLRRSSIILHEDILPLLHLLATEEWNRRHPQNQRNAPPSESRTWPALWATIESLNLPPDATSIAPAHSFIPAPVPLISNNHPPVPGFLERFSRLFTTISSSVAPSSSVRPTTTATIHSNNNSTSLQTGLQTIGLQYLHELKRLQDRLEAAGYLSGDAHPPTWIRKEWNEIAKTYESKYPFKDIHPLAAALAQVRDMMTDMDSLPSYHNVSPGPPLYSSPTSPSLLGPPPIYNSIPSFPVSSLNRRRRSSSSPLHGRIRFPS